MVFYWSLWSFLNAKLLKWPKLNQQCVLKYTSNAEKRIFRR